MRFVCKRKEIFLLISDQVQKVKFDATRK